MERKVEQLLLHGVGLIVKYKEPFILKWKKLISQKVSFAIELDSMISFAFQKLAKNEHPNVDTFIFSLLTEWQSRFTNRLDEEKSIYLVTTVENMYHKLLKQSHTSSAIDHQAIQAFFSRILDHALLTQSIENKNEKWSNIILATNVIPIRWLAVVKKEQEDFTIDKVVCSEKNPVPAPMLEMCSNLKATQIDHLSMAISRLLGATETPLVQIPCLNDTLIICTEETVTVEQTEFIKSIYLRQLKLNILESKMAWKDASLLFLQRILGSRNAETAVQAISEGLVDYMPFKRCALFLYNQYEETGIGVSGYNVSTPSVQQIKEAIFQLPLIKNYLQELLRSRPLFFENAEGIFPKKYVQEYKLSSLIVLPIFVPSESRLLGIALLDQGEDTPFTVSPQTLASLIKFGQYAGELLHSIWDEALQQFGNNGSVLTVREKEVLRLIADGASINEAALELHLSSYTVRDYVSLIIQKLSAKNRTDAAVKAIRMKVIS